MKNNIIDHWRMWIEKSAAAKPSRKRCWRLFSDLFEWSDVNELAIIYQLNNHKTHNRKAVAEKTPQTSPILTGWKIIAPVWRRWCRICYSSGIAVAWNWFTSSSEVRSEGPIELDSHGRVDAPPKTKPANQLPEDSVAAWRRLPGWRQRRAARVKIRHAGAVSDVGKRFEILVVEGSTKYILRTLSMNLKLIVQRRSARLSMRTRENLHSVRDLDLVRGFKRLRLSGKMTLLTRQHESSITRTDAVGVRHLIRSFGAQKFSPA